MATKKVTPILMDDPAPEKEYVLITKKVDSFNIHTEYVELKKDQCNICGFSVCKTNKLPEYELLDIDQKARVDGTLESHKAKHTTAEKPHTVLESELPGSQLNKARIVK